MQRLGDLVRYEMSKQNFTEYPYIDDIIGIQNKAQADVAFQTLQNLITSLGLPINPKKLVAPTSSMICMGILVDIEAGLLRIPDRKLQEIKDLCFE